MYSCMLVMVLFPQCALRRDELLLSNHNAVVSALSGIVTTGRPISSHKQKLPMRFSCSNSTHPSSKIRAGATCSAEPICRDRPRRKGGKLKICSQGADGTCERIQSEIIKSQETQCWQSVSHLGYSSYLGEKKGGHCDAQNVKMSSSRENFASSFCQNVLNQQPKDVLAFGDSSYLELNKIYSIASTTSISSTSTSATTPSCDSVKEKQVVNVQK